MGTWNTFWRLNAHSRRVVVSVSCVIVASRVGLRVAGYRRWIALLARSSARAGSGLYTDNLRPHPFPAQLALLTAASARNLPFKPTCLERSIGLWWLLRRHGFGAEIRIGGRKAAQQFEAHAWVECGGLVLDTSSDQQGTFSVFEDSGPVAKEVR